MVHCGSESTTLTGLSWIYPYLRTIVKPFFINDPRVRKTQVKLLWFLFLVIRKRLPRYGGIPTSTSLKFSKRVIDTMLLECMNATLNDTCKNVRKIWSPQLYDKDSKISHWEDYKVKYVKAYSAKTRNHRRVILGQCVSWKTLGEGRKPCLNIIRLGLTEMFE